MIQVREEIECGYVTDKHGNRWRKYRPGKIRTIRRLPFAAYVVAMLAVCTASYAGWYFLIRWIVSD